MIGNAVEVDEAVDVLAGAGPSVIRELTIELGGDLLQSAGIDATAEDARSRLKAVLHSGAALEKFREMVAAQSGDLNASRPRTPEIVIESPQAGVVRAINTERLGHLVIELGGGRKRVGDPIDHSVGIEWLVRLGDTLEPKTPVARVFARAEHHAIAAHEVAAAVTLALEPIDPPQLIVDRIK
jgi:thymidine phosphorylase